MYEAFHQIVPLQAGGAKPVTYDVVGPAKAATDRPRPQAGCPARRPAAVPSAGAYCMSMASNHNTRRAAEVLVDGSQVHVIREREEFADQVRKERLLP